LIWKKLVQRADFKLNVSKNILKNNLKKEQDVIIKQKLEYVVFLKEITQNFYF
jgi:hypothetical protein